MADTDVNVVDPFAPQEGGLKVKFAKLKIIANPVKLEKGASYQVKEVHDRDGNVKDFNGKKLDKTSKQFHVILLAKADDREGNEYEMYRDMMTFDATYTKIVYPALVKVFGKSENFPRDKFVFVKMEEAPTGESFDSTLPGQEGTKVAKTTFKVVAKYANEAAMKAAEKEHFSRFNGNGDSDSAGDAPKFDSDTVALIKKQGKQGKTAAQILDGYIDNDIAKQFGSEENCIKAIEAVLS